MLEPMAIYSLPETDQFYRIKGAVDIITKNEVDRQPGFIFAPFDPESEVIYRISGDAEKWQVDSTESCNWEIKSREVKQTDRSTYQSMFRQALESIETRILDKIVLSVRDIDHSIISSIPQLLQELRGAYRSAFIYLFYLPGQEFWVGASPELLLDTNYPLQTTMALAGTRSQAPKLEDWPQKEREEHRYVEQFIEEIVGGSDFRKEGPRPVVAGPVYHLKSTYSLDMQSRAIKPFELHPGPALSGYPVKPAVDKILQIEDSPRRYYTGFLGPVWQQNQNRFYINLRCLEILKDFNVLYAGGGLTIDSEEDQEWMEIQEKLSTLRTKLYKGEKVK